MLTPDKAMEVLRTYMLVDGFDVLVDFDRSHGNTIVDARSGRSYLDMFSMVASQPLGMNHPAMTEESFLRHMAKIAIHNPSNSDIYNGETAEFVSTFMELAAPPAMRHLFLVAGGTLAVENALKVAMDWKVRRNLARGLREEKGHQVIHFRDAFHGRSGYSISMTNTDPVKTKYFAKFPWPRVTSPRVTFPAEGENLREVERLETQALAEIKRAIHDNKDDVAALIIEPIQGEGGDNHFRGEFLRALRQVCDESEVFFIVDEVQTGVGMTGRMWCYQHFGFEPDAIAFGKKTQVCGILVGPRVDEVENNCFQEPSRINSTWGGNTVDMVRAARYFRVIEKDGLVANAATVGDHALGSLRDLQKAHPADLTNARGRGLFLAIDLVDRSRRPELLKRTFANGLLILPTGSTGIRLRPSLVTTRQEIDSAMEILARSLREVGAGKPAVAVP